MKLEPVYLKIFRFNPNVDSSPSYRAYEVPWTEGLLLLSALKHIRENQDESLAYREYCCGCGWCSSCFMMVNGKGTRSCCRLLKPGERLLIEPMRGAPVIKDLVVDFNHSNMTDENSAADTGSFSA